MAIRQGTGATVSRNTKTDLILKKSSEEKGEVGLIMNQDISLVFIKGRLRHQDGYGSNADSLSRRKQLKFIITEKNLIVTFTSNNYASEDTINLPLNLVIEYILPKLEN